MRARISKGSRHKFHIQWNNYPAKQLDYIKRMKVILLLLIAGMVTLALQMTAQDFYHTGNQEPIETNHQPGLVLAGGAGDNDDAMKWMLERADGGDVVVLRASGSDGYNNYFYSQLGVTVNSVTSIVIRSTEEANNEAVIEAVNNAEVVFIAGGNQWNYVDYWRDSALLDALNTLINEKKITIGGTSAGMAVLGEVVFTAENGTVWSSEALGDPYHWRVKLEKDFLDVPYMKTTVTDSHYNRIETDGNDRKGRHVAFMARMIADWDMPAGGIAANEYTAIAVDENGKAMVFGHPNYPDYGYFLKQHGGPPEVCEEGTPLTWKQAEQAIKVYKIKGDFEGSGWFDIDGWEEGEGGEWHYWYVDEGELFEADADDETGITTHLDAEATILLYPNPARDVLNVSIDKSIVPLNDNPILIRILRPDGTVVHTTRLGGTTHGSSQTTSYSINIEHLNAGIYILEIDDGRQRTALRWVKSQNN